MEKIKAEIVPADLFHAHVIAENVRSEDAEEIWASTLQKPFNAMKSGIEFSEVCRTGLINGIPVCMWGVVNQCLLFNEGTPWMVASRRINDNSISMAFLRRCRKPLMEIFENYDTLVNYVDARNVRSIKWLKYMGFTIEEPEPYGVLEIPFHKFWMKKESKNV